MNEESERLSSNGWQNIGICLQYAYSEIKNTTDFMVYMFIVRNSFGYCKHKTNEQKLEWWCSATGTSKPTFIGSIKRLEEDGHIVVIRNGIHQKYGGGTKPNSYAPVFPSGIGKIKINGSDEIIHQEPLNDNKSEGW